MALTESCYRVTRVFPADERYGIVPQMRRAAVSIPSNLAEGHCRRSTKAYANHVSIALGSHAELETYMELSARLGYVTSVEIEPLLALTALVGRLLNGLHKSLVRKAATGATQISSP
jgi:four helix bundle protein